MVAMHHGRAAILDVTIGGSPRRQDRGVPAPRHAGRPARTRGSARSCRISPELMASGVYAIPKIEVEANAVVTNTTPIGPFRGAGRPEATQAIERAVDLFAAEIGLDPAEVRRKNFIARRRVPVHDRLRRDLRLRRLRARARPRARGSRLRGPARRAARRRARTATPASSESASARTSRSRTAAAESEFGDVEITPDGGAILRTGSFSHGQGHETTFAMIVADKLGLPVESVRVVKGDTDEVAAAPGRTARSRRRSEERPPGRQREEVVERARQLAADYLEIGAGRHGPRPRVGPLPRRRRSLARARLARAGWQAKAGRAARRAARRERLQGRTPRRSPSARTSRWSRSTRRPARVELLRHVAVDDAGTLINPRCGARAGARRCRHRGRTGALRGGPVRRGRQPADGELRQLRVPVGGRAAVLRGGRDGDADAAEPARREGNRRVGHDRRDARGTQRRRSTRSHRSASVT